MRPAGHATRGYGGAPARTGGRAPVAARRDAAVLVLLSAVFVVSASVSPSELPAVVLCPFRALTGLPCAGCGMTRAFCALGHGDWRAALGYNALSPFVFLALLVVWARTLAALLDLRAARTLLDRLRPSRAVSLLLLALTLAWWVARLAAGI